MLIFVSRQNSHCQSSEEISISIKKGQKCTDVLDAFKNSYNVLIAYSPSLSTNVANEDKRLIANDIEELFTKLCYTYQLDFVSGGKKSFLVRSEANDILNAPDVMLHIRLIDSHDKNPVSYAAVYDDSRKYFGFTDEAGDCFIKVPKNFTGQKLTVHSLSHKDQKIIVDTENVFHDVRIMYDPVKVLPVTINTIKKRISFSKNQGITLDNLLLQKMMFSSVFQQDVLRTLQLMPGVSAINDSKSSLRIRGANEEATLLILDEMPVYKADHFFGIFGAFNSQYIHDISLIKNNIPVEYGGRTSGLVKMESSKDVGKLALNVDVNLLNSGIAANIPISENLGIKISGRTTYTDLLNSSYYDLSQRQNIESDQKPANSSQITSTPSFDFYDFNGKVSFHQGNHSVNLNLFASDDQFLDNYNLNFKNRLLVINEELFTQESFWKNFVYGLNYKYTGKTFDIFANGYNTEHNSQYDINSYLVRREKNETIRDTVNIFNVNSIRDIGFKLRFQSKSVYSPMVGIEHVVHKNDLYLENDNIPSFEINRQGRETNIFSQIIIGNKSSFFLQPALRLSYIHDFSKLYWLPQVYISQTLTGDIQIKASASRQLQYTRLFEHENALGQKQQFFALSNDKTVPLGIGSNFMAGIWKNFNNLTFDLEMYYRTLDGAIIHATQMPGLRPTQPVSKSLGFQLFSGESKTLGADVSLAYENKKYFSMLTYTLSKTENKFAQLFRNQSFPASDDSRHQLKWINTFTAGNFDFSANYIAASGRPYLDLSSIKTNIERISLDVDNYVKNLPSYHRIDLGVFYKCKIAGFDSRFGISVFNVANRINVKYRQFVYQIPNNGNNTGTQNPINTILGSDVAQLGRTFNISFNIAIK